MQRLRWRGGVGGAGAVAGVDSHLLQLNLACLRGSTLCTDIPSSAAVSLPVSVPVPGYSRTSSLSLQSLDVLDVPIWQLDNLFLKRAAPITQAALSSNVSVVFLFSVIVLNQSQKSVIMTALLIVTGALQPQIAPQTKEYHACYKSLQNALRENCMAYIEVVIFVEWLWAM